MIKTKIKCNDGVALPEYATPLSAGVDLSVNADMIINSYQIVKAPTGIVIEAPPGYFIQIVARSSLCIKKGLMLANSVGIIDGDYCGPDDEISLLLYNFTPNVVAINKGERLAQAILIRYEQALWIETKKPIKNESRGGFGSTLGIGLEIVRY